MRGFELHPLSLQNQILTILIKSYYKTLWKTSNIN
jgi:hypothetical protein